MNAIAVIYSSSKGRVRLGEKLSEHFHITTGVLQGDTLAPFSFIIVLDYILKQSDSNHGIKARLPNSYVRSLPDLDFAFKTSLSRLRFQDLNNFKIYKKKLQKLAWR